MAGAGFPTVGNGLNKMLDEMRARGEVERGSSEDVRLNRQADVTTGAFAGATAFIGSLGGALIGGFVGWIVSENQNEANKDARRRKNNLKSSGFYLQGDYDNEQMKEIIKAINNGGDGTITTDEFNGLSEKTQNALLESGDASLFHILRRNR